MLTRDGRDLVVNGAPHPLLVAGAARVRLRLLNATAADVLRLAVLDDQDRRRDLHQVASDGSFLERPVRVSEVLLPPGGRADVVVEVRADSPAQQPLRLCALPYSVNADGSGAEPVRTLLSLDLPAGPRLPPLPARLGDVPALDVRTAVRTRRIELELTQRAI
jgi:FtsP/CotA-like multicopper oxidase with cupredoxin domain